MNIITNLDNASRSGYDDIPITIIQSLINILCRRIYYFLYKISIARYSQTNVP